MGTMMALNPLLDLVQVMSWKAPFDEGVTLFKTGKYPEALQRLNQVST